MHKNRAASVPARTFLNQAGWTFRGILSGFRSVSQWHNGSVLSESDESHAGSRFGTRCQEVRDENGEQQSVEDQTCNSLSENSTPAVFWNAEATVGIGRLKPRFREKSAHFLNESSQHCPYTNEHLAYTVADVFADTLNFPSSTCAVVFGACETSNSNLHRAQRQS
jgi:hypothetical protein